MKDGESVATAAAAAAVDDDGRGSCMQSAMAASDNNADC